MRKLTEIEVDVLRMADGQPTQILSGWGAAVGVCLKPLSRAGYLTTGPDYRTTDKGRAAITAWNNRSEAPHDHE